MRRRWPSLFGAVAAFVAIPASAALAQPPVARPQPPPAAGSTARPGSPASPSPSQAKPAQSPATARATSATETPPTLGSLGSPLYPSAVYLGSYDAGRGQRFYLYGCTQSFAELVAYYRTVLKDKGELVFDAPATQQFDVGKFKETDVDFTPGVTIKDYTWAGSPGFLNPKPGATPAYFPTVIQITSPPAGMAGRPK